MATQVRDLMGDPRRRQMAIVGALFVLLLAAVWFFLLRGSGDPAEQPVAVPAAEEPAEPESASPPPERTKDGGGAVETFEVFASRDPFEPLVDADAAASTGGDAGGGGGATATFIDGGTGGGGETNASGGGSTSGGSDGSGSVEGHRVSVVDVFEGGQGTTAQVEVDGTVYRVQPGETFADSFQLVEASGRCATMLYGDDQFTLCEGEEILK